ncbi:hypothetical protein GCM10008094_26500 [Aidingimonas halophila]|nr:hypothetical protein GCM10008094_26500 [Aidingimonas halophila]
MILLSRLRLSPSQSEAALRLCPDISDWGEVTQEAKRHFVLPLVYRHLNDLEPPGLPREALDRMRQTSIAMTRHNLCVVAAQRHLMREVLGPQAIPHLFFKGPALAARYYGDPAGRFCRDIDLLVAHKDMVRLLEAAVASGYRLLKPDGMTPDRQSLTFAVDVHPVITLMSPLGVPVELHRRLDTTGAIYDTDSLLARTENLALGGGRVSVMPTDELFVYLCLHHTRHRWSHLHWLADLDVMQRSPDFDLQAVHACAVRRGLVSTVEASLALYRACAGIGDPRVAVVASHGRELLSVCLTNLQGDRRVELAQRQRNITTDFAFSWQSTMIHRWSHRLHNWLMVWRPSYSDYRPMPLRPHWQWVYRLTRPFRAMGKYFIRLVTPDAPSK